MKVLFSILISAGSLLNAFAGDPKFPVTAIPEALKKDANVVIRESKVVFTILAQNKATCYKYFVATVLNPKGNDYGMKVLGYDKNRRLGELQAAAYDANGELIKRVKKSEIYDQSAYDGSLFSDNRIKVIDLKQATYPYTVEFEYVTEYNYLYGIDTGEIIPEENVSVQSASSSIVFPLALAPRYKTFNIDFAPAKGTTKDGLQSLTWTFQNLVAIKEEPFSPDYSIYPEIVAAPTVFEYSGYKGNMSSWEEYGNWIRQLNVDRDKLPDATKTKIQQLTKDLPTTEAKVKALYEFMQGKTRYVNIALGIGDLQPFDAAIVDQNGYGDCKALSNYMVALLKEVGIKSYYATVMAGWDATAVVTDFPSHQANHAIVAVPNGKDTLWLECTSQTNPFGYMGRFTGNRKAMLVTENGGKLVNTPRYTAENNLQVTSADVYLDLAGDGKAKVNTAYHGLQYENGSLDNSVRSAEDQKKWIQNNTHIPSFDLNGFEMKESRNKIPSVEVSLDLTLRKMATVSGKRIFMTPNLLNKNTYIPPKLEGRKTKVTRSMAYTDLDTIRYHLPDGIYPEFLPEPVKLKNRFGEYEASFKVDQNSLIYIRRIRMNEGVFPAETYTELQEFYKSVSKADATKIVFMSKT
jgi:transglutaminase-like putative cysteine protease